MSRRRRILPALVVAVGLLAPGLHAVPASAVDPVSGPALAVEVVQGPAGPLSDGQDQTVRVRVTSRGTQPSPVHVLLRTGDLAVTGSGVGWACSSTGACRFSAGLLPGTSADLDLRVTGPSDGRTGVAYVGVAAYPGPTEPLDSGGYADVALPLSGPSGPASLRVDLTRGPFAEMPGDLVTMVSIRNPSPQAVQGAIVQLSSSLAAPVTAAADSSWACREATCWTTQVIDPGARLQVRAQVPLEDASAALLRADVTWSTPTAGRTSDVERYPVAGRGPLLAPEVRVLEPLAGGDAQVRVVNRGRVATTEPTEVAVSASGGLRGEGWVCFEVVSAERVAETFSTRAFARVCRTEQAVPAMGSSTPIEITGQPRSVDLLAIVRNPEQGRDTDGTAATVRVPAPRAPAGDVLLEARDATPAGSTEAALVRLTVSNAGPGRFTGPVALAVTPQSAPPAPWQCTPSAGCRADADLAHGEALPDVLVPSYGGFSSSAGTWSVQVEDGSPVNGYAELSTDHRALVRPVLVTPGPVAPGGRRTWRAGLVNDSAAAVPGPLAVRLGTLGLSGPQPTGAGWRCDVAVCVHDGGLSPGAATPLLAFDEVQPVDALPGRTRVQISQVDPTAPDHLVGSTAVSTAPVGGPRTGLSVTAPLVTPLPATGGSVDLVALSSGELPVQGPVEVVVTAPPGSSASGTGWTCADLVCRRPDAPPVVGRLAPITVRLGLDPDAATRGATARVAAAVRSGDGSATYAQAVVPVTPVASGNSVAPVPPSEPAAPPAVPPIAAEDLRIVERVDGATAGGATPWRVVAGVPVRLVLRVTDAQGAPVVGLEVRGNGAPLTGATTTDTDGVALLAYLPTSPGVVRLGADLRRSGVVLLRGVGADLAVVAPGAPAATVIGAAPGTASLRAPSFVVFDRDVLGNPYGLVLRTPDRIVPVVRSCFDASFAPVDCGRAFRVLLVTPSEDLVRGRLYTLEVAQVSGVARWEGITFRAALAAQEDELTATWADRSDARAIGGSYRVASAGARWSAAFAGSGVRLWFPRGPDLGTVRVVVDGVPREDLTLRAAASSSRWARTYATGPGAHTVSVTTLSGRGALDARSTTTSTCATATGCETSAGGTYGWRTVARAGASGGRAAVEAQRGASLSLAFEGTGAALVMGTGPSFGAYEVRVDGRRTGTYDGWARTPGQRVVATPGLAPGRHVVSVVVLGRGSSGGSQVVVDRVVVR